MAITMLLIVPIFLYALFLDDLLRYRLSQQEAVLTTLWDFTVQNYDVVLPKDTATAPTGSHTLVQRNARLMFCDHESGSEHYDRGGAENPNSDCGLSHHVGAVVAHECWLNGAAHQITCGAEGDMDPQVGATGENDLSVGASGDSLWKKVQSEEHPNGGMFSCTGNLVVENYLLPRTFLQQFNKDDKGPQLSKDNWKGKGGNAHSNGEAGDNGTAYFFKSDQFSLVTDSWAYNADQELEPKDKTGQASSPGENGNPPTESKTEFYRDVNTVFTGNLAYNVFRGAATTFKVQLGTQGLVDPVFISDDPTKPSVAISPKKAPSVSVKQDTGSKSYFSSPWKDGSDVYQKTYDARGDNYMGCQDAEKC